MWCPSRIHIRTNTIHSYINDIANVSNIFKINLFADDTSLFHTNYNCESLNKETNQELTRISTWLATNKLVLNISKTNYMIFTSKSKSYNNISNIHIDGNEIQQVNKTKCLGIIIEEYLNWATHINHLCNIIARNVGILLSYFIPAYVSKNSIPFINIVAPTILHIIMGKFILFTST